MGIELWMEIGSSHFHTWFCTNNYPPHFGNMDMNSSSTKRNDSKSLKKICSSPQFGTTDTKNDFHDSRLNNNP